MEYLPCCQTENIYLRDRQTKFVMVGLELLLGSWSIFSAEIASFIRIPFRRCKWNVNDAFRKWETNMEASKDASDYTSGHTMEVCVSAAQ